jgi:hypothetical protein
MIYDLVLFPFRTVEREAVAAQLSCNSIHSTPNRSMRERTRGEAAESAQAMGLDVQQAMGLDVHRRSARGFCVMDPHCQRSLFSTVGRKSRHQSRGKRRGSFERAKCSVGLPESKVLLVFNSGSQCQHAECDQHEDQ